MAKKFFEKHAPNCTCSYCYGEHAIKYGLNIPRYWKVWNAWWVIKLWPKTYFRWTNTWLRRWQ